MQSSLEKDLEKLISAPHARFYMPGHKGALSPLDITEIPGADDLREPNSILAAAQSRAAKAFGAAETFFLVGGSSLGIQAMIAASCRRGDTLYANQGCHISVKNTCKLLDINLKYIKTTEWGEVLPETVLEIPPTPILITSPNYFGVCSNLPQIAEICHSRGVPLLVDQAHGAHLRFSPLLPTDAMTDGADIACMSAHKTLPSLTQTAYLHRHENSLISAEKLQNALNLFQTTSPSYLFMISLDNARRIMEEEGEERLKWLIQRCNEVCKFVEVPLAWKETSRDRKMIFDHTRLVFKASARKLAENGIIAERQEGEYVILIPSIYSTDEDFSRLINFFENQRKMQKEE